MSGPRCNLPVERHEEILARFDGRLSAEEEREIRRLFPQYLFFQNVFEDDGFTVTGGPTRLCTCTACGESFEAVRGFDRKGKLHNELCTCPQCGETVEGKAIGKFRYEMWSLESWVKVCVARRDKSGALLIEAGDVRRRFNWEELTGEILWSPTRRYYIARDGAESEGLVQAWAEKVMGWRCGEPGRREWVALKTVAEPFAPNGFTGYKGAYKVIGLREAIDAAEWRYCQIGDFYKSSYGAGILEPERKDCAARWVVRYLAWYARMPQIEMAVKLGLSDAVEELIENGKKNARLLNWEARRPNEFLRISQEDAKLFLREGMGLRALRTWKEHGKGLRLERFAEITALVGTNGLTALETCAKRAGCTMDEAARYVEKTAGRGATATAAREVLFLWRDYLSMAEKLAYDLKERTVAMPKELRARHDAAAETLRVEETKDEMTRYKRRRRMLEKRFGFSLGELKVVIPTCSAEIIQEGKTLRHCVGGYAARHIEGKTTILFIRKRRTPGRSYLTVELYEEKDKWKIKQIHGYRNEGYKGAVRPEVRHGAFLEAWLDWVNDGSPRDKKGEPIMKGPDKAGKEKAV